MKLTFPALLACALAACATHRPETQRFVPIGEDMESWGELEFSNQSLSFANRQGEMKLKYVGQMPDTAGEELAGASVYRVENANSYFTANRNTEGFCSEPPRWAVINSPAGAPAWSGEIRVSLLTVEDWTRFEPGMQGHCAGSKYVRAN
ncbi:MAG TPA: hypothetical protein VIL32_12560 [Steroidobacteraceae bacterium]